MKRVLRVAENIIRKSACYQKCVKSSSAELYHAAEALDPLHCYKYIQYGRPKPHCNTTGPYLTCSDWQGI